VAPPRAGGRVSAIGGRRSWTRLALLLACVLCAASARAQSRIAFAEYELTGPCDVVVLDLGRAGSTRIEGRLAAGETRRVVVPIPTSPGARPLEPRVEARADAHVPARFLAWQPPAARFTDLPAGLRARPVPVASATRVRVGIGVLLVLAAAGIAGLGSARRPFVALALAVAAAVVVYALARRSLERDAAPVEVLDGIAGHTAWQRSRAARDSLELPGRGPTFDVVTDPPHAAIRIEAPLDPSRPAVARASGAQLSANWSEPWDSDALDRTANALAPLAAAWRRVEGNWTFHGAWPLGAALGPAVAGPAAPGWLVAGLPQGVEIVVGEMGGAPRSHVRCTYP